ncbi:MAG: uroporphyrinogen-III synthase [Rubrivivax sp.]
MRVIVTRPIAQARPWVQALQALGLDAVALPLIAIEPVERGPIAAAWSQLDGAALAMFVSPNAVQHFFDARPPDQAWPAATLAGSTGPGTSAALRAAGIADAQLVEPPAAGPFDTETLWQQRLQQRPWQGRRVLIVRGDGGRDWLAQTLRAAGAQVDFVTAYRRRAPVLDRALVDAALQAPGAHCWHFSSSEAIAHLLAAVPGADWRRSRAEATHPRIAERARRAGFGRVGLVGVGAEDLAARLRAERAESGKGASIESPPL